MESPGIYDCLCQLLAINQLMNTNREPRLVIARDFHDCVKVTVKF